MFSNVLAGVDGRQGGRDAIALARQLAAPDAGVTLAHVYGGRTMGGRAAALAVPLEAEASEQMLTRERTDAGMQAETVSCYESSAGRGLHELAEQRNADLLVVGSSRHALLGRVLMGDDTRAALNAASCAIAIAPRGYAQAAHRLVRLGVGYDGSPQSVNALTAARELAARYGAKITALWVVSLQSVREEKPIPADWSEAIDRLLDQCSQSLDELGDVESAATYGEPKEELVRFGKGLDLLIVGSCGYGPIGRLFHGSVSSYLIGHAPCPLLVLPRSASNEGESAAAEQKAEAMIARVN
jgi:nucleotide-binding universal stress UspA family protein